MQPATRTPAGPARGEPCGEAGTALPGRWAEMAAGGVEARVRVACPGRPSARRRGSGSLSSQAPSPAAKEDRTSCCGPTETERPRRQPTCAGSLLAGLKIVCGSGTRSEALAPHASRCSAHLIPCLPRTSRLFSLLATSCSESQLPALSLANNH